MFPGAQPRINNADFVFRCFSCGEETTLDDSLNGECAACSGVHHLDPSMTNEEVTQRKQKKKLNKQEEKRKKKARKIAAKVKHAKKCDRSTTRKGEKTRNH